MASTTTAAIANELLRRIPAPQVSKAPCKKTPGGCGCKDCGKH